MEYNKQGDIHKCPACGAVVSAMDTKCPECGHEFSNVEANATANRLLEALNELDMQAAKIGQATANARKLQLIQNLPVPNTKSDLIEVLTMCQANVNNSDARLAQAWKTKTEQVIAKAEVVLKGDPDAEMLISKIRATQKGKKNSKMLTRIIILVIIAAGVGAFIFFKSSKSAEAKETRTELIDYKENVLDALSADSITADGFAKAYENITAMNHFIEVEDIQPEEYRKVMDEIYSKVVISLIKTDPAFLADAAELGLEYREKLNDDNEWKRSTVYKTLVGECEAQNVDDSPLQ